MEYNGLAYKVEPMQASDIREVMAIERLSFPTPWPMGAYRFEIRRNPRAYYFVVRPQEEGAAPSEKPRRGLLARFRSTDQRSPIVGYGGFWHSAREAHISTIAVHPRLRRKGIGQLILIAMIEKARSLGADHITLEVRASNLVAQSLYRKYGFQVVGRRRRYYSDNNEDAVVMVAQDIDRLPYSIHLQELRERLIERLERSKDDVKQGDGYEELGQKPRSGEKIGG
ncbi:MAG: ribosomal protein S18-alanine N-acetyltransferase [Anaerolineae bacterium]